MAVKRPSGDGTSIGIAVGPAGLPAERRSAADWHPLRDISVAPVARGRRGWLVRRMLLAADLGGLLGSEWKKADADVNGEFGYLVALSEFIPKRAARTAAAGWGGDRYVLYENKAAGELLLVQYTTWDTENDAKEFFQAYSERTQKRYKLNKPVNLNARPLVHKTNEGLASIDIRGKDVVLIEGAQTREQLARLSQRAWQSKKR